MGWCIVYKDGPWLGVAAPTRWSLQPWRVCRLLTVFEAYIIVFYYVGWCCISAASLVGLLQWLPNPQNGLTSKNYGCLWLACSNMCCLSSYFKLVVGDDDELLDRVGCHPVFGSEMDRGGVTETININSIGINPIFSSLITIALS
ncbi:hypothetical protein Tco_0381404 [Tanacetum coccineum]